MKRLLMSLPELGLRVHWLRETIEHWPREVAAARLNQLCAESERSDAAARQALLTVACYFVAEGKCALVNELYQIAEHDHLLSLDRMLRPERLRGAPAEKKDVPDYGAGRELTVGERRVLARHPSRENIERLLSDPHPLVLRELLKNPHLTEEDVLRIAARRPAHIVAISALAKSTAWLCRRRIRFALVQNPGVPAHISGPLLVVCNRAELNEVMANTTLRKGLRLTACELLATRPPLERADPANRLLQ
jgi:hypothetical protein